MLISSTANINVVIDWRLCSMLEMKCKYMWGSLFHPNTISSLWLGNKNNSVNWCFDISSPKATLFYFSLEEWREVLTFKLIRADIYRCCWVRHTSGYPVILHLKRQPKSDNSLRTSVMLLSFCFKSYLHWQRN